MTAPPVYAVGPVWPLIVLEEVRGATAARATNGSGLAGGLPLLTPPLLPPSPPRADFSWQRSRLSTARTPSQAS